MTDGSPRLPHSADLRKSRFSEQLGLYMITKRALSPFEKDQSNDIVTAFLHYRGTRKILLHAFVVMPDHWHALITLTSTASLGSIIAGINRHAGFNSRKNGKSIAWQTEYHDHKVRPFEKIGDIIKYIEYNPVRKSLVDSSDKWQWSSANPQYAAVLDRQFLGHERWK